MKFNLKKVSECVRGEGLGQGKTCAAVLGKDTATAEQAQGRGLGWEAVVEGNKVRAEQETVSEAQVHAIPCR